MKGKHVLITGGSAGIGRETALGLAKLGAEVTLLGRNADKAERAAAAIRAATLNQAVSALSGDLSDLDSVHAIVEAYRLRHKWLDILVNNAGPLLPRRLLTPDGQEQSFATIYLGHYLLTQLLLDRLKAAEQGRIVFVTCAPAEAKISFDDLSLERGYTPFIAQYQAKGALFMFMRELSYRLAGTSVTVNAVLPGKLFRTELRRQLSLYQRLTAWIFGQKPAQGAEAVIRLATTPYLAEVTNRYFNGEVEEPIIGQIADDMACRQMWQLSQALTHA
jgi:NAD(P)-dependent dehydrogenase (short-subunit alcohol dehydrogenase family)